MLKFLKRRIAEREARTRIGIQLHHQIKEAFDLNEPETSARLSTFFTAGYIYGFVRIGFSTITGVSGERATDKHIRHICDGVLPNKLWEIFDRMLRALEIAKSMDDQHRTIRGSELSPVEAIKLFEAGAEIGFSDAKCFNSSNENEGNNLKKYLVGQLDNKSLLK